MLNTGSNTDYASKMPDLAANANIQEALQTYHYGTIDPTTADSASFAAPSGFTDPAYGMVGKLKWIKTEIDTIKAAGASGGIFNSIIDAKGDLIVGTADNTPAKMSTGANGYVLKVDSSNLTYGVSWSNPDDTHLNLSGGTLVGNITIARSSGNALLNLEAVSGSTKGLVIKTGSSSRWEILSNSTAESSTATGSDLVINRYNNSGSLLGTVLTVTRSSGDIVFSNNVTVSGTLTISGLGVSSTELGYLSGVSSDVQTQINAKAAGAASSTDNAVARFDSTTGKIIQNSGVIVDDSNNITGVAKITATNAKVFPGALSANRTTTQGLTNNAWTKIQYNTEDVDLGANFASGVYTVPTSGVYLFTCYAATDFSTAGLNALRVQDTTNGAPLTQTAASLILAWVANISVVSYVTSGTTIEFQWFTASGTGKNISAGSNCGIVYLGSTT